MPDGSGDARGSRRSLALLGAVTVAAAVCIWWGDSVTHDHQRIYVTPPGFFGHWQLAWPAALTWALPVAVVIVVLAPVATRSSRRWAAPLWAAVSSLLWMCTLAASKGWRGFTDPVLDGNEYRRVLPRIGSVHRFVDTFVERLDRYPLHVTGHPPGFPLVLWWLHLAGLDDPRWEAALVVVVAASAAAAITLAVRELVDERAARSAAMFVGVMPAVVWMAVSADAFYAGLAAWSLYAIARATRPGTSPVHRLAGATIAGLLAGALLYCTYGAPLILLPAAAIAWHRRSLSATIGAAVGAALVVAWFTVNGFWWFDGLAKTRHFYFFGVASRRPYSFFLLANLVVVAIAMGPAVIAGLARLVDRRSWWLVAPALAAMVIADLSGMARGEVERIWLPLMTVAAVGAVGLDDGDRSMRLWLATQLGLGIAIQATLQGLW